MAKRRDLMLFIDQASISSPQKKGLMTRLCGLASEDESELDERQLDMLFEGMSSLKDQYLKENNTP